MKNLNIFTFLLALLLLNACKPAFAPAKLTDDAAANTATNIKSITSMVNNMAYDVTAEGPYGWLIYFEDTPTFYIASGGKLIYPDYKTADNVINHKLAGQSIKLNWKALHIEPISDELANVRAGYHEKTTFTDGSITEDDGYFTGLVHKTAEGWKLRNAHWSVDK